MGHEVTVRTVSEIIRRIVRRCERALRLLNRAAPDIDRPTQHSSHTVNIEWNIDFDSFTTQGSDWDGNPERTRMKGRCTACWGGVVGRMDEKHEITGIKCRVCGTTLEGDAARKEYARMDTEWGTNEFNRTIFGLLPRYADDAKFVRKVLPTREPVESEQFAHRIGKAAGSPSKRKKQLTRQDFPPGSPGYLVFQATTLMAGVEGVSRPSAWSVVDLPDVRFRNDGTAIFTISTEGLSDDPQFEERRLARRMGETMTAAMISAFACELAMKAIALTAADAAAKDHDLLTLFKGLPEPSRRRITADYPEIETLFNAARHRFGKWRYFETTNADVTAQAMIDTEQARDLGKAARVILDETEMMGLGFTLAVDVKHNVHAVGDNQTHRLDLTVNVKGREAPPKNDPPGRFPAH